MSGRKPRVAVYGWAFRTPLGDQPEAVLQRMLDGERAAAVNPRFDARSYPCKLAAALPEKPSSLSRHRKFLRRMGLYAVESGLAAMRDARALLPALATLPGERLGLFFGYGGLRAPWDELMPAMQGQAADLSANWENGLRLLHPFFMLQQLSNNAHALCAEELLARGEGVTLSGANAGAQALSCAQAALESGAVDAALCVAYDSLLSPEVLIEQGLRGALSAAADVATLIPPYAALAAGAVPGEAAAALLLMRAEPSGAVPLCYLRGADAADAGVAVDAIRQGPAAATLARAAGAVLEAPIAVVDGAAQAVAAADLAERQSLATAGFLADGAVLTATLAACGQLGAASPLVQAMLMATALRTGQLPPIAGLAASPPAAGPLPPLTQRVATTARAALCLSAGPPGLCGAVCVEIGAES